MLICTACGKKSRKISWSRHQKGSSGATEWPLRAQIHKRVQRPNLHVFKGSRFCTKCLRQAKASFIASKTPKLQPAVPQV